jgi:hypothetical protein
MRLLIAAAALVSILNTAVAQTREEKVRDDRKRIEAAGYWIYNNYPAAVAEAKSSGKPIVAVLRCLPCEACVKLDDEMVDSDERVKSLLDQFVRVRIVSTNGLDLSLFQFDTDQSFAVFFFNADGTVYGRFGTRSHQTTWEDDVSVHGLAAALEGALELHKGYPGNKKELASKRGPRPKFAHPEEYPSLASRYESSIDYSGDVVASCIHCHSIGDADRDYAFQNNDRIPESTLFPFPHPKSQGLILDPNERATISRVVPNSVAASSGLKPGDRILSLAGQPILSIADLQWVLHGVPAKGGEVAAGIEREGVTRMISIRLPTGWRRTDDIAWRASSWELRRRVLGGAYPVALTDEERAERKIKPGSMALHFEHVGQYSPHDRAMRAGAQKGDVLVAYDGRTDLLRETDLFAYALLEMPKKKDVELTLRREGRTRKIRIPLE